MLDRWWCVVENASMADVAGSTLANRLRRIQDVEPAGVLDLNDLKKDDLFECVMHFAW